MGQRVAIVFQHVNNYLKKEGDPEKVETRVFYHHWGIGRILPTLLVEILNGSMTGNPERDNFADDIRPNGCADITSQYGGKYFDLVGFDDPEAVGRIIKEADNNNGGLYVRVTENKEGKTIVEYAYMLGREEGGNYDRFCTFNEWKEKAGLPYTDRSFLEYYYHAITYFGAIEKASGERPKIFKS